MILWFDEEKIGIKVRSNSEQVQDTKKSSVEHTPESNRRPVKQHCSALSLRKSCSEAAL